MCTLQALFAMLYIIMFFTQHGKWGYAIFVFCLFFCVGGENLDDTLEYVRTGWGGGVNSKSVNSKSSAARFKAV